ncbi:S66 peptidase family protein [Cellulosimicrobium cellulans]|uniref:S66 peptidase family protein n=1 Tax=Cellulosimicrobium cellulans TaxID=1710 RepID=UPI0020CD2D1E
MTDVLRQTDGDVVGQPVKRLRAGDRVRLVSPCSPPYADRVEAGVSMLRSWGLEVEVPDPAVAGAPLRGVAERAAELQSALADPEVHAVLVTRAGSGARELVDEVDLGVLREQPKFFGGFSDVGYLHAAVGRLCDSPSFHVPEIAWNGRLNRELSARSLRQALMGEMTGVGAGTGEGVWSGPTVTGTLTGGNLSILAGIDAAPRRTGPSVLLLEDLRETPESIGRLLPALQDRGHTEGVVAVVFGQFEDCGDPAEVTDVLTTWADGVVPTFLTGVAVGHGSEQHSVALNWPVTVNTRLGTVVPAQQPTSVDVTW